ncbi:hypothetical protein [Sedimentibacter sp.]|uniref:hypothetical protein n=1 Tax=Sedimentibacter sp. TaxID=1960295 RepID=UPI00289B4F1A|nr:hypothetical protein [Sedimentibacter sp.]
MNNNYKIIRTIFENVFQRVVECKEDESGDVFYSNIITSRKVINLIDLPELKSLPSNILEAYNTDDRIYIYTYPLNSKYKGLKDGTTANLTLKQQFNLSEKIIMLAQSTFNMTDVVQQKILDLDRIFVDDDHNIYVDLNLVFEQEYDIADNETFKRLGNILHYIFSGTEIVDYNISDSIPPDVLKIIVRCLTKEYVFPKDIFDELKQSPIYGMIFAPVNVTDINRAAIKEKEAIEKVAETEDIPVEPESDCVQDDDSVLNLYLSGDEKQDTPYKNKSKFSKNDIMRFIISMLIVIIVLLIGNKIIKMFNSEETIKGNPNEQTGNEKPGEKDPAKPEDSEDPENETPSSDITDSTEVYFNDKLLENTGYSGSKAEIDSNIYLEGKNSLLVKNEGDGKVKSLFAVVDFNDEKFSYLLKQQIGIGAKLKSEKDVEVSVVLEAYKNGALASNFHTKLKVYDDMWSPLTVPINVSNADYLNIYVEYEGQNKVWIDSVYIDVIK